MKCPVFSAVLLSALGLALTGCHPPANGPSSPPSPDAAQPPSQQSSAAPAAPPARVVVYVLNPKATGEDDLLVAHTVPLRHPQSPASDAVAALVQSPHSPILPGTALRGLSLDSGVATVDFSQSPVNETGGEGAQSAALNALAMTLGQFPAINTFQIHVKGRPDNTFGQFTTDGPIAVIRPGDLSAPRGQEQ